MKTGKHEYVIVTMAPGPNELPASFPEVAIEIVVVLLALAVPGLAATAAKANETDAIATTPTMTIAKRVNRVNVPSMNPPRPPPTEACQRANPKRVGQS